MPKQRCRLSATPVPSQMGAALRNVDALLSDVMERLDVGGQVSNGDVQHLAADIKAMPEIFEVLVLDEAGRVGDPSLPSGNLEGVDLSDREYFRFWREHGSDASLHISPTILGRAAEQLIIPISRSPSWESSPSTRAAMVLMVPS